MIDKLPFARVPRISSRETAAAQELCMYSVYGRVVLQVPGAIELMHAVELTRSCYGYRTS